MQQDIFKATAFRPLAAVEINLDGCPKIVQVLFEVVGELHCLRRLQNSFLVLVPQISYHPYEFEDPMYLVGVAIVVSHQVSS